MTTGRSAAQGVTKALLGSGRLPLSSRLRFRTGTADYRNTG
jgi:hypothetical protein